MSQSENCPVCKEFHADCQCVLPPNYKPPPNVVDTSDGSRMVLHDPKDYEDKDRGNENGGEPAPRGEGVTMNPDEMTPDVADACVDGLARDVAAKHTPGPWRWREGGFPRLEAIEPNRAIVWYTNDDDGLHATEGDKRLLEAAPDLLAACEAISAAPFGVALGDLDRLRAAIAKAKPLRGADRSIV